MLQKKQYVAFFEEKRKTFLSYDLAIKWIDFLSARKYEMTAKQSFEDGLADIF